MSKYGFTLGQMVRMQAVNCIHQIVTVKGGMTICSKCKMKIQ